MIFRKAISVLTAAMALISGAAQAAPLSAVTLWLDFAPYGVHAPFYLGIAKGFYKGDGIDLKLLPGKGSANAATLAGVGRDSFAFADSTTAARLIAQGLPATVVLGLLQKSTLAIFVPDSSGIDKPADLKGKRISMCAGDGMAQ